MINPGHCPPFLRGGRGGSVAPIYTFIDNTYCPQLSHEELAKQLLLGGAKILQLRMKGFTHQQILRIAKSIKQLKKKYPFTFIINDDVWAVRELQADGVHLGQNDMTIEGARRILGPAKIIGLSTHNQKQFLLGMNQDVNYLALGPIFPTKTKQENPPVGMDLLRELVPLSPKPVVAIGGIDATNSAAVLKTGVTAIAMISALTKGKNIVIAVRKMQAQLDSQKTSP